MVETAIVKREIHANGHGLELRNLDDMWRFATMMFESGTVPASFKSAAAVCVALQAGSELGLSYTQSLNSLYVVNGVHTIYGDTALALVRQSGLLVPGSFNETITGEGEKMAAYCCCKRVGDGDHLYEKTFTVDDAKRARLWNNDKRVPWILYPKTMLKFKARAVLRDAFGDVLKGLHLTEEMDEYNGNTVVYEQTPNLPNVPKREDRDEVLYLDNCKKETLALFKEILRGQHKDATPDQVGETFMELLEFTYQTPKEDIDIETFNADKWQEITAKLKADGIPLEVLSLFTYGVAKEDKKTETKPAEGEVLLPWDRQK